MKQAILIIISTILSVFLLALHTLLHTLDAQTPTPTPKKNLLLNEVADEQIAFFSDVDGNFEIYLMNLDGSNRTNLTNHEAFDIAPAWSPTGDRIAFSSDRDGNQEIYIMDSDGAHLFNLTQHPASDIGPVWSPTHNQIAFSSDRNGQYDIYIITLDDMSVIRLTDHPEDDIMPYWSPDGNQIAFTSYRTENEIGDVFVIDVDGTNLFQLIDIPKGSFSAQWHPDGSLMVIGADLNPNDDFGGAYMLEIETGHSFPLSLYPEFRPVRPGWSPDGNMTVFESMEPYWALYVTVFKSDDLPVEVPNTFGGHDIAPVWRPKPEPEATEP